MAYTTTALSKLINVSFCTTTTMSFSHNPCTYKRPIIHATATPSSSGGEVVMEFEEGQLERPKWTGNTPLSRLVGALIKFKPLFSVMKIGARQVLISTAEKTGIPWRDMTNEILDSDVYKEKELIEDPSLVYPDYYLNPFHAYDEGNLSWLAAAEAEAATMSMVRRAIPNASSLDEANQIVRGNWLDAIEGHHLQYSGNSTIRDILDIGCSVGVTTRFLANKFSSAKITGLDLSPYFLAVAQYKDKKQNQNKEPIRWIHANGENTGLPSNSFDLVSIAYVFHECPERAIRNMATEAFRLLRPGGTFAITDNSPKSKILQELSPVLFTLMKSTEPFLDDYYLTDLEGDKSIWPAAIKSGIMTTADIVNLGNQQIQGLPADIFAIGAGLVYVIEPLDYIPYLCVLNYTYREMILQRRQHFSAETRILEGQLNYPTFAIRIGSGNQTFTRTVTNVGKLIQFILLRSFLHKVFWLKSVAVSCCGLRLKSWFRR